MVVLGEDPQRPRLMIGREPDPDANLVVQPPPFRR
jgi:hypothetical protein